MRARMHWFFGLSLAGVFAVTGIHAQDRPPILPGDGDGIDAEKLHPFARSIYHSTRRGAEWLANANRSDGLFVPGYVVSLNVVTEEDPYLRQVGASYALAKAARFTGSSRYAARAKQAVLALLASTKADPNDARIRYTIMPSSETNRLGAAAMLVLAISDLPEPGEDLLEQSEQLCGFIRSEQQKDGSIRVADATDMDDDFAGQALYAVMRSQQYRPETWKTDSVRKALAYYRTEWQKEKRPQQVPWRTAAFAELYMRTKEPAGAEIVYELSDWICRMQLAPDPRRPMWQGGFAPWKSVATSVAAPTADSAACGEGLADACRVARQAGDVQRFGRYRDATEKCLQFLSSLQYIPANSRHFKDEYQERLGGAFFAAHQDGNVRLDYTQHALCAMIQHLQYVAEIGPKNRPGSIR